MARFKTAVFFFTFDNLLPTWERSTRMKGIRGAWSLNRKRPLLPIVPLIHHCIHYCILRCHHHQQRVGVRDCLSSPILTSPCSLPTFCVFCARPWPLMPTCKTSVCVHLQTFSILRPQSPCGQPRGTFQVSSLIFLNITLNLVGAAKPQHAPLYHKRNTDFVITIPCPSLLPHAGQVCFLTPTRDHRKYQHWPDKNSQRQRPLLVTDGKTSCRHQGAPRPTRPLALERRRLLQELGTARCLTGSSCDQSPVETAKTEIARVEKHLRRFSRCLLRRRRAMWLEEGIRKTGRFHCLQIRTSPDTGTTPSQIEWAQDLAKDRPKGGLALHEYTWNDFRREHLELQDPGDSETTTLHREEAPTDYARTLRRAPARRSCPPWSIPGRLWLLLLWPTFLCKGKRRRDTGETSRQQARSNWKLDSPPLLAWKQHVDGMRRLLSAVALLDGSSQNQVGWALTFESCHLVRGMCDFWKAWHRGLFLEGTWPELPLYCYGFQRARQREVAVASHLALAGRCRHESISFVDESLDMVNAIGSLDTKTRKT